MSQSSTPVKCENCKATMGRDFKADFGKQPPCDTYPFASYAAGVNASEVPAMMEIDKKNGVPTHYTADGDPILTSPSHRKKYCRVHGLYDRNAGYSDPAPINR